jgi:hypothetical protein
MTNQDNVDILQGLYSVIDLEGLNFAKRVAKNIEVLEEHFEPINEIMRPSKEFEGLSEKVRAIQEDPENPAYKAKVAELEKENMPLLKERKAQQKKMEEALKEECKVKLTRLPNNCLPKNINARQLKALALIIDY